MARPKGSKNKKTLMREKVQSVEVLNQVDAQEALCAGLAAEIEELEAKVAEIKGVLKEKKAAQKAAVKELEKIKVAQEAAEKEAAEAAKRVELAETIQKLLDTGLSAGDILEKLK